MKSVISEHFRRRGREPLGRLREIYDELCRFEIRYEQELVGAREGRQLIRPPAEVLAERDAAGNCLDIALVAAGLCLRAVSSLPG